YGKWSGQSSGYGWRELGAEAESSSAWESTQWESTQSGTVSNPTWNGQAPDIVGGGTQKCAPPKYAICSMGEGKSGKTKGGIAGLDSSGKVSLSVSESQRRGALPDRRRASEPRHRLPDATLHNPTNF
ncbi:hypothetical protein THAOC_30167, partial [Thalassiosira oceanica]